MTSNHPILQLNSQSHSWSDTFWTREAP